MKRVPESLVPGRHVLNRRDILQLATMFGLSYLQNTGVISEKTFQTIAIAVAVVVVVINGIMRRKVKL